MSSTSAGLAPGTIFAGDFRVERVLASGGMGVVYVATQLSTSRARAIKVMLGELARSEDAKRRFIQEASIGAQIDSEHVVEVLAAGVDATLGVPWLAMELLQGEDLAAYLRRVGPLAPRALLEIFEQLAHAVGGAHRRGIVHRDLKPENVFLAETRRTGATFMLKVLDFGIAKLVGQTRASLTAAVGTPLWMAPEQMETGTDLSPRADVWALGLIAFTALTGRSYWRSAADPNASPLMVMKEVVMQPLVAASERARELGGAAPPEAFGAWFEQCVVRDPAARFADASVAFAALREAFASQPPAHAEPPRAALPTTSAERDDEPQPLAAKTELRGTLLVDGPIDAATNAPQIRTDPGPPAPRSTGRGRILAGVAIVAAGFAAFAAWKITDRAPEPAPSAQTASSASARASASAALPPDTSGEGWRLFWDRREPGSLAKAIEIFEQSCAAGHPNGCAGVARARYTGEGLSKDGALGFKLAQEACAAGSMAGCAGEAKALADGESAPRDEVRARTLFEKSCDAGEALGCNGLGWLHNAGRGVPKDGVKAATFFTRACDGGFMVSCLNLGINHVVGSKGYPKDEARALALFEKACAAGLMRACAEMGDLYFTGAGTTIDLPRAISLFQKACEAGDGDGCRKMAASLRTGKGVAKDEARAADILAKACVEKDLIACSNLGLMYESGSGVAKDEKRASELHAAACDGNSMVGCELLGALFRDGRGVKRDGARAVELLAKACDADQLSACNNLGVLLETGQGAPVDMQRARALYRKACDGGNADACTNARRLGA